MKRIKVTRKQPNPLFERWLKEWKEDAIASGSDMQHHFSKALLSLQKYPLPLKSGKDCIILQHFGAKLCAMLEKKLSDHEKQPEDSSSKNDPPLAPQSKQSKTILPLDTTSPEKEENTNIQTIKQTWNIYCYVVLFVFYTKTLAKKSGHITQVEISLDAQHTFNYLQNIKDSSVKFFDRNMKLAIDVLIKQGYILQADNGTGLTLTQRGKSLADKIFNDPDTLEHFLGVYKGSARIDDTEFMEVIGKLMTSLTRAKLAIKSSVELADSQEFDHAAKKHGVEDIQLHPNSFDVILLIDTHEVPGKKSKLLDHINELEEADILFEVRNLKVGDFLWVARCRNTEKELVLPYIVERKRIDDLSASIIDGRFHEQKFRLRRCGLENIIYIVEGYSKNVRTSVPPSSLLQASTNSVVQNGFIVKYTKDHRSTMSYLATVSKYLRSMYEGKTLSNKTTTFDNDDQFVLLQEFEDFNKSSSKSKGYTVDEMFIKQLLQLKGISVKKAAAIVEHYPTPIVLMDALFEAGTDGEKLIANIQYEENGRQIGIAKSKVIYEFYTRRKLM